MYRQYRGRGAPRPLAGASEKKGCGSERPAALNTASCYRPEMAARADRGKRFAAKRDSALFIN